MNLLFARQLQTKEQSAKLDLNKKSLPKQKTIQTFNIDAQQELKILPCGK